MGIAEIPRWHCNKRWTDLKKAQKALSILERPQFEKRNWTEGKQAYYAQILSREGLSSSTNPRSTRAILGTFKFFGFAWTKDKKLLITQAGRDFIHSDTSKTLKRQLLKWQYPNPFEAKGNVAPYTKSLQLFPFRTLLEFLRRIGPIREDELALFVWKTRDDTVSEFTQVEREIQAFRKLDDSEKLELRTKEPLFVTNHEYEAHLRPYIIATGLCLFDSKSRLLSINPAATSEVDKILSESVEVKTNWRDEDEWFEYFGNTKHYHPPRKVEVQLFSPKGSPPVGFFVQVEYNGAKVFGTTDNSGSVLFSLYEDIQYKIEVRSPRDGNVLCRGLIRIKPKMKKVRVELAEVISQRKETVDDIMEKIRQILAKKLDDELRDWVNMLSKVGKIALTKGQLKVVRGARFEELIYHLLNSFKDKVFDKVEWNGSKDRFGLPMPAQKVCEQSGKKLPDILAFQDDCVYVIETTLLRGRAQWREPEAVSVPDHVENMTKKFKGKEVIGLFIAERIDASNQKNLVVRAINQGYKIVPMEVKDFLKTIELLKAGKAFWKSNLEHIWNIYERTLVEKTRSPS